MTTSIDSATLAQRIDELESRMAITDLIAAYTHAFDREDRDLMISIWHEDALLDLGEGLGTYKGIDRILEAADGFWTSMDWLHHWCPNALVTLDGDTATAAVNLDCLVRGSDGPVMIGGNYFDRFERRAGQWRFAERRFVMDYWTPLENWKPTQGLQQ